MGVTFEIIKASFDSLSEDEIKGLYERYYVGKHKTLEERSAEFGGALNLDGEFDWD